jgi:hypothetical protein
VVDAPATVPPAPGSSTGNHTAGAAGDRYLFRSRREGAAVWGRVLRAGRPDRGPLPGSTRALLGTLGAVSFGLGGYAVFVTDNEVGTGVLLAFGGVLLVLALLGDRVESFELGGAALRLRAEAAERLALAEESELDGDPQTAARLRAEARSLLALAGPIAHDYRRARRTKRSGPDRTRTLRRITDRAGRLAEQVSFDPTEVSRWLRRGTEEERVVAIAMMRARPELRDLDAVVDAVEFPCSPFEQYTALRLATEVAHDLDAEQRAELARVVTVQSRSARFRRDADRRHLAEALLAELARYEPPDA